MMLLGSYPKDIASKLVAALAVVTLAVPALKPVASGCSRETGGEYELFRKAGRPATWFSTYHGACNRKLPENANLSQSGFQGGVGLNAGLSDPATSKRSPVIVGVGKSKGAIVQEESTFQEQVLAGLAALNTKMTHIEADVTGLKTDMVRMKVDMEKMDCKFDTYPRASDSVWRLATTIVITAASFVVLSPVLQASVP